jgi:hypothetical protein
MRELTTQKAFAFEILFCRECWILTKNKLHTAVDLQDGLAIINPFSGLSCSVVNTIINSAIGVRASTGVKEHSHTAHHMLAPQNYRLDE